MLQTLRHYWCRGGAVVGALVLITLLYNYDVWISPNIANTGTRYWNYISSSHLQQVDYKGKPLKEGFKNSFE